MSFFTVVEVDNEGFKLYDENGNALSSELDGSLRRLLTQGKIEDAGGTVINPATDEVSQAIRDRVGEVSATPTANTVMDRLSDIQDNTLSISQEDFATETTLSSIKDTDGIKKITDQLPAGTNEIGKVAQGTKGAGSNAWPQVLYDSSGNVVGVVLDGAIYRVQTDSKISKGATDLVHLDAIDTDTGKGRLKATIYTPDGDPVSFGSALAPNPTSIRNSFMIDGGSPDLRVNGSVTPVVFTYDADATYDISLQEIKFVLVSNSVTFGSDYFGATAGPLTNGLLLEVISNGQTGTVHNFVQNESFVNFASPGAFNWVVSSKDMMSSALNIGGALRLHGGTADKVRLTVRDDIHAAGVYFRCFVKGNLLPLS